MNKIYAGIYRNSFENRIPPAFFRRRINIVPADLRNFFFFRERWKMHNFAWDKSKPFKLSELKAFIQHDLGPKADAQDRFSRSREIFYRGGQTAHCESFHTSLESSYARQNQSVRRSDFFRIIGYFNVDSKILNSL